MKQAALLLAMMTAGGVAAAQAPASFRVVIASESGDVMTWLRPDGPRLVVERTVPVGIMPADIDGPHGVAVAPDMKSYYVTIAHGVPFGTLWRYDVTTDSVIGRATVELFPTTVALTPDGQFALVTNSDFHGERPRTNVVSVVHTESMAKLTDLPVCDMPHGVRVNRAGTLAYVACMHSDELVEIDLTTFEVGDRVALGRGHGGAGHEVNSTEPGPSAPPAPTPEGVCAGTFVAISPDDARVYVPCNEGNSLQVRDASTLALIREIPVGTGAYNAEVSPDGRLVVVTNKKDQSVSLIDAVALTEVARVKTTKKIVHGVVFSPDGKYAYVSQESIGSDPGAVDIIDLAARRNVGTVAIPAQPTGLAVVVP